MRKTGESSELVLDVPQGSAVIFQRRVCCITIIDTIITINFYYCLHVMHFYSIIYVRTLNKNNNLLYSVGQVPLCWLYILEQCLIVYLFVFCVVLHENKLLFVASLLVSCSNGSADTFFLN